MHAVSRRGGTDVDTVRQEGLARCSRPFREPDGFARIVTLALGPGFVRGDRFACDGRLGAGARLNVVAQSAARALGGGAPSASEATWRLAPYSTLHLLGEPLVAYEGAEHRATLDVELGDGATFAYLDVIARGEHAASVSTRLRVRSGGALLVHDALRLTSASAEPVVGSALYLRAAAADAESERLVALADALASAAMRERPLRIGVGSPAAGGVAVRALGREAWHVRAALGRIVAALAAAARDAATNAADQASSGTRSG